MIGSLIVAQCSRIPIMCFINYINVFFLLFFTMSLINFLIFYLLFAIFVQKYSELDAETHFLVLPI